MPAFHSPQDVYARQLLSHRGYPLWTPEPNVGLPGCYQREGLKLGDVGIVDPKDGSFDVFFNITSPPNHRLHEANGVPNNFTQIPLGRGHYKVVPNSECPGRHIISSAMECTVSFTDPLRIDGKAHRLTDYQFSQGEGGEGAMLILPQGAERHTTTNELLLLDIAIQNAVEWYRFARERLYRDIGSNSLYLITGFHKAESWSLASFRTFAASSAKCKIMQLGIASQILPDYCAWEAVHPLDWRVGPRRSDGLGIPNQAVFIVGFRIAVNEELLHWKRVTVKVDNSDRTLASKIVGFGSSLANIYHWWNPEVVHFAESAARNDEANESSPGYDPSKDDHQYVGVENVPQILQPFHPSDVINRYMLRKEPLAKIAVTHDSQWIDLLEKGIIDRRDMLQADRLEAAVSKEYNIVAKNETVYLQKICSHTNLRSSFDAYSLHSNIRRNVVFFGETGTGKSSAINLILGSNALIVSDGAQPCTETAARQDVTLKGTRYSLWDTRGLREGRGFLQAVFGENSKRELEKFLKERHRREEIDLLVFCVRGARVSKASVKYYKNFCAITRRLAAPVVVMVTFLEKETDKADWWNRNSSYFEGFNMEFDDHACVSTLMGHPRSAESRESLIDLITKDYHWKATETGSYFGSRVPRPARSVPSRKGSWWNMRKTIYKGNDDRSFVLSSNVASSARDSFHTPAVSPSVSISPDPIVEPPKSRSGTASERPRININSDSLRMTHPQPPSDETSGTGSRSPSMFSLGSESSDTTRFEAAAVDNEDHWNGLAFKFPADSIRRRKGYPTKRGAFGDVWECDLIMVGSSQIQRVAVKVVKTDTLPSDLEYQKKKLHRELKIWGKLQHRNVVPLLGVVSGFGPLLSMVSPWFYNETLSRFLAQNTLNTPKKNRLLGDVAAGLSYLHSQDIVHGNLHSNNILIDDDGAACLTDFGLSFTNEFVGTAYLKSSICGNVQFTDPAFVKLVNASRDVIYPTKACDVYSFGGVILHVVSGKKPYDGIPSTRIFTKVLDGVPPEIPTDDSILPPRYRIVIEMCWNGQESKRPLAESLVNMFHDP